MTSQTIWAPPLDSDTAKWQKLIANFSVDTDSRETLTLLHKVGLFELLHAKRKVSKSMLPFQTLVVVLEGLAARCPSAAATFAQVLVDTLPIAMLGNAKQKAVWLDPVLDGQSSPPAQIRNSSFSLVKDKSAGETRVLNGTGRWVSMSGQPSGFVLFTDDRNSPAGVEIACLVIPFDHSGLSLNIDEAPIQGAAEGGLRINSKADSSFILAEGGRTAKAMAAFQWVDHIVNAAQISGLSIALYEEACKVLDASHLPHQQAPQDAGRLAICATKISASRMMLHHIARSSVDGNEASVAASMALLSVSECFDYVLSSAVHVFSGHHALDASQLQRAVAARRFLQSLTGSVDTQAEQVALAFSRLANPSLSTVPLMTETTPATPSIDTSDRVSDILDAAADAFMLQGYDATSLDYIGDALGITKGSIYYHYRSKADLFVAVFRRNMELNFAAVLPIAEDSQLSPLDRLYQMAYTHSLLVMKHLSYQRVAVQGIEAQLMGRVNEKQRERLKEVVELRDRYQDMFIKLIQQAIDSGELPDQNSRLVVKPLFSVINGITMWFQPRAGETQRDREHIAEELAQYVISGLKRSYVVPSQRTTSL